MSTPDKSALPPGNKRHWLLGTGLAQALDPLGLLKRGQRKHGDIVYFHMHHGPSWLLSHPDHVQHVLADNASNYVSMGGEGRDPLLGKGLFASQGDYWRRQRRLVQPSFHRARLAQMVDGMVRDVQAQAERWAPKLGTGEPVELLSESRRLILGMLGTSIFSQDVYEHQAPLRAAVDHLSEAVHGPSNNLVNFLRGLLRLDRGRIQRFLAAIEQLDSVIYRLIAERRQDPAGRDDIMTMLLEAKDPQGVALTDVEVRDELINLYIGGRESTAVALTWSVYEVARNPEVEQRVRGELARVLGDQPLTAERLASLHYTRAVVEETLRLHSPAWQFTRRAVNADELGGWKMAPNTKVIISPHILHRHPAFWVEPERFNPERFLPEQKEARHRYAYLPFGAGQRQCVGNGYALTALTVALATLLQRYQLCLVPEHPVVPIEATTHHPSQGVLVTLHPAPAAA